jgi:hypothetical protein
MRPFNVGLRGNILGAGRVRALCGYYIIPKESNQRKGDPGLPPLRGSLRCSTAQAAAELALRAQTVLAETP